MWRGIFIIVASLISGCAQPVDINEPIKISIQDIQKDPWFYHDKTVSITGTFNECTSYTCRQCDSPTPIDPYDDVYDGSCMGVSFLHDKFEDIARFSTVTVQGIYRAQCSGVPKDKNSDEIIVCTDRASQIREAYITEIVTARHSIEGHISSYGDDPIERASEADDKALRRVFKDSLPSYSAITDEDIYFSFVEDRSKRLDKFSDEDELTPRDIGYYPLGGVCVCYARDIKACPIPTLVGHTYYTSAGHLGFQCYSAEKREGEWGFSPIQ